MPPPGPARWTVSRPTATSRPASPVPGATGCAAPSPWSAPPSGPKRSTGTPWRAVSIPLVMPTRSPLTVVIPTFNEAAQIGDCVRHLSWVGEVIVADGCSNDGTGDTARAAGAKVIATDAPTIAVSPVPSLEQPSAT